MHLYNQILQKEIIKISKLGSLCRPNMYYPTYLANCFRLIDLLNHGSHYIFRKRKRGVGGARKEMEREGGSIGEGEGETYLTKVCKTDANFEQAHVQ